MIVHLLVAQARPNLTSDEERELGDTIQQLGTVPGVDSMVWGPDFSGRGKGYTHAAVMHFPSREALQEYQQHEKHQRLVEVLNRLAPDRLVIDFQTESPPEAS